MKVDDIYIDSHKRCTQLKTLRKIKEQACRPKDIVYCRYEGIIESTGMEMLIRIMHLGTWEDKCDQLTAISGAVRKLSNTKGAQKAVNVSDKTWS